MDPLASLSPEEKDTLERFGFDPERFRRCQEALRQGRLSPESNLVTGKLQAPDSEAWEDYPRKGTEERDKALREGTEAIRRGEVGAIILNGGMATRFGGKVKGAVKALDDRSFLELKIENVALTARRGGGKVPIYLMNSFATDRDTRSHLEEKGFFGLDSSQIQCFCQGISMRLTKEGEIFRDSEGKVSFHGPGHGDCTLFFRSSGCLGRFLGEGGKYLFISNVDNLAARLDPVVIGTHILSGKKLTAEVAPKWSGDKGGAPVIVDGRLWIVEGFRFPPDFDQDRISVFNTNTFTVHAESIDQDFDLTDCYVEKTIGDVEMVQIETLVGELTRFIPTHYLRVKRTGKDSRFYPIKTPQDLEDVQEDLRLFCRG